MSTYSNAISLYKDILRLDVEMRDVPGVAKSQRGNDLRADQSHFFRARPASLLLSPLDPVAQAPELAKLHHQKRDRGELEPVWPLHRQEIDELDDKRVPAAQHFQISRFFFRRLDLTRTDHFDPLQGDDLAALVVPSSGDSSPAVEFGLEDAGIAPVFLYRVLKKSD